MDTLSDLGNELANGIIKGRVKGDFNIFGMTLSMQVLNSGEQKEVYAAIGGLDQLDSMRGLEMETLARAMTHTNGHLIVYLPGKEDPKASQLNKEQLRAAVITQNLATLGRVDYPTIKYLFDKYGTLIKKQDEQILELKKKHKMDSEETDGKSENKSE